jgi:hypothetical protein
MYSIIRRHWKYDDVQYKLFLSIHLSLNNLAAALKTDPLYTDRGNKWVFLIFC